MSNSEPIDLKDATKAKFLGILKDIEEEERKIRTEEEKRIEKIEEGLNKKENQNG